MSLIGRLRKAAAVHNAVIAKEQAMAAAEAAAREQWKESALEAIRRVASRQDRLTTDDVWAEIALGGETTHEPRVLGVLMVVAARHRWIEKVDAHEESGRAACHRRPLQVWSSLLQTDEEAVQ